jgi:hypothetical protein
MGLLFFLTLHALPGAPNDTINLVLISPGSW